MARAQKEDRIDADERFFTADRLAKERLVLIPQCRELIDRRIPNASPEELKRLVAKAQQKIKRLAGITDEYNANHKKPLPSEQVDRTIETNFASQLNTTVIDYLARNDQEFKRLYDDMNSGKAGASVVAAERIGRILREEYNIPFEAPVTKIAKK